MQYLYNGTKLPDIYTVYTPELQEQYPFAVIGKGIFGYGDFYTLRAFAENAYYFSNNASFGGSSDGTPVPAFTSTLNAGDTAWGEPKFLENSNAAQAGTVWTNFDWVRANGNIFMAASTPVPVPVLNPSVLMQGFMMGDAVKRMRGVKPSGKLVGYLYGGVGPLPDVNGAYEALAKHFEAEVEQVKQVYPYATVIYNSAGDNHRIFLFGALPYVNGENCMIPDVSAATIFDVEENAWVFKGTELFNYGYDAILGEKEALVWTSHNILTADGSTYLSASEPVPVYE